MVKVDFEIDTTPPPHGLVFDGDVRGRYTGEAVQDMATSYGWTGTRISADGECGCGCSLSVAKTESAECYDDAITEAEDWLNAHVAEAEVVFHWFNGSFFYEPLAQIEEQY